jgi:hypothetical protein
MFGKDKPAALISEHERSSALWQKIRKHLEARRELLRAKNDGDLDERKTARLRGQIRELKNLMALDNPMPESEADDPE